MRQVKQLDFTGHKIFAGIDVHKKSWKVCIRSEHTELKTFSQNPSAEELSSHLQKNYPNADFQAVYEAGFCGFHHQRQLSKNGIKCMVVHPADVPIKDKEKQRKSDIVDCRKLSQTLSSKDLTGIYIPSIEQQDDRGVIRVYQQFVKNQTRFKNQIRAFINFQGIVMVNNDNEEEETYKYWSNNFTKWLKNLSLTPSAKTTLDLLIEGYEQARKLVLTATRQVRALSKQDRHKTQIANLRSIPGVGEITALLFATEIGDINRFQDLNKLCDYIGLVPRIHGSGDKEAVLGLTHRGHRVLRRALVEASWVTIRRDPAMTLAFNDCVRRGMMKKKAIIKIARKLLNRIRYVMKNQTRYVTAVVE